MMKNWLAIYASFVACIILTDRIISEPVSLTLAAGGAIASLTGGYFSFDYLRCKLYECCSDGWLKFNTTRLAIELKKRLYGQHIVIDTVVRALKAHVSNIEPKKPLVLSFHGWTGSGKNYVADIIARNFYVKGKNSAYVKLFLPELINSKTCKASGDDKTCSNFVQSIVVQTVKQCARSLFIFDEMDHFDPLLLNAIKPFLDFHTNIDNVDYRKSIFIFMSNTGGDEISKIAFKNWQRGASREKLVMKDMEQVMIDTAFNEEGGLKFSNLIKNQLIDHFVPFLPLERHHVIACIKAYLSIKQFVTGDETKFSEEVADLLQYFPKDFNVFSKSGCKRIAQKVDLMIQEMLDDREQDQLMDHSADHL